MRPVTLREMVVLALPAMASAILNNAFRVIDQYSVQWLGTAPQAAVGSCTFVMIAFFSMFVLTSAGVGPLLARAIGAVDEQMARRVAGSGLAAAVAIGAMVCGGAAVLAYPIADLLGLDGASREQAALYVRWTGMFGLGLALGPLMDAMFIAQGRTAFVMGMLACSTLLNGVLNWLLIYELGLGIRGAALASCVSRGLTVIIGFAVLWRSIGWTVEHLRPSPAAVAMTRRIFRIGLPITANTLTYALVYWAMLAFAISPLGPEVNAALGIGFSALEGFTWPMFHGISLAVASIVGRRLGAGQSDQAIAAVRLGFPLSTTAGLGAGLLFWFGAEPLTGLFTEDPGVHAQAIVYAKVLAFSQLFVAYEALSEGALSGSGDTRTVLWWSAPVNLLRVPLAWLFAHPLGWGAIGVWWAINLTTYLKAFGKGRATLRGEWTATQV